jgi:hypothetical protein
MTESEDETLKAEIDEIMNRVAVIMDKVEQVTPEADNAVEDSY